MPPNELEIDYPFKPFIITQPWGNPNPNYAEHFNKPDWKLHNGTDANVGRKGTIEYQTRFLVYSPVVRFTVFSIENRPTGGGNEIWLISDEPLQMFERKCHALIGMFHLHKVLVPVGHKPVAGELIAIGNNTGYSTGPHTHIGLYRVDYNGSSLTYLDKNSAEKSFNPELFFTKKYAIDKASLSTLTSNAFRYFNYLVSR